MLKSMLISDNNGLPFYSRVFDTVVAIDDALLSGLLSAIGTIGRSLFHQEIATIIFGEGKESSRILVITRELLASNRQIFFVFFYSGEVNVSVLRSLSTMIFMQGKEAFRNHAPETRFIAGLIDKIIDNNFGGLKKLIES